MLEALYSQEKVDELREYHAEARGEAKGEARGGFNMLASLVCDKLLAKDVAARKLGISIEEFDKRVAAGC